MGPAKKCRHDDIAYIECTSFIEIRSDDAAARTVANDGTAGRLTSFHELEKASRVDGEVSVIGCSCPSPDAQDESCKAT